MNDFLTYHVLQKLTNDPKNYIYMKTALKLSFALGKNTLKQFQNNYTHILEVNDIIAIKPINNNNNNNIELYHIIYKNGNNCIINLIESDSKINLRQYELYLKSNKNILNKRFLKYAPITHYSFNILYGFNNEYECIYYGNINISTCE